MTGECGDIVRCSSCCKRVNYVPWHYSKGSIRHMHACNECWEEIKPIDNDGLKEICYNLSYVIKNTSDNCVQLKEIHRALDKLIT